MELCNWNARKMDVGKLLLFMWITCATVQNNGVKGQDCLFRYDLCDWTNDGEVDWVQTSVPHGVVTEHFATVPLLPTGGAPSGREAVLTSMTHGYAMTMLGFYYRVRAPNSLTAVAVQDGVDYQIWSVNGTAEDDGGWIEADVPVPESTSFKIVFIAQLPGNSTSFVGLTNLTLRVGEDECASMPCQNGGACNDGNGSFTCVCMFGFKGELCQIDKNAPSPTEPRTTKFVTAAAAASASTISTSAAATPTEETSTAATSTSTYSKTIPPKPQSQKTPTKEKTPPTYGTPTSTTSPPRLPSKPSSVSGKRKAATGMDKPVFITVIAVASVVAATALAASVWIVFVFLKKRSWRPRYHERGLSMESISNNGNSPNGKWTSTVDLPGAVPDTKLGLTPVAEDALQAKVENIYVTSPQRPTGFVNVAYDIGNLY